MNRLLLIFCFLSFAQVAFANEVVELGAEQRVITLPQDQGRWYVSLFGDVNDAEFQLLRQWFCSHPGLKSLGDQTHFNVYTNAGKRYQRYAKTLPGLPCVRVQNSEGVVTSEFWGEYLPKSSEALFQGIHGDLQNKTGQNCLRLRCRPRPEPTPEPEPGPLPTPEPEPLDTPPLLEPQPQPQETDFPWLLAVLSALAGGGIGVAQGYKKEHIDVPATY